MYNKKMKNGKAWGKEIDRMYSMRPVEKSVELLGEVYNIYREPVFSEDAYEHGCNTAEPSVSYYTVCINAYGIDAEIGLIDSDGTLEIFPDIANACKLAVNKYATLNKNGTPNRAIIKKLCNAEDEFGYGELNILMDRNAKLTKALDSIHNSIISINDSIHKLSL